VIWTMNSESAARVGGAIRAMFGIHSDSRWRCAKSPWAIRRQSRRTKLGSLLKKEKGIP